MRRIPVFLAVALGFLFLSRGLWGQSPEARRYFLGGASPSPSPGGGGVTLVPGAPVPLYLPAPASSPKGEFAPSGRPAPRLSPRPPSFLPQYSLGGSLASRYDREGWGRNSSPVAILQAELQESGLYLGLMGTYNFSDSAGRERHFQDSRLYLGYSMAFQDTERLGPVYVDFCWTYHAYPGSSRENAGSLSLALHGGELWRWKRLALAGTLSVEHNYGKNETFAVGEATLRLPLREDHSLAWENSLALFWGDSRRMRRMTEGECRENALYTLSLRSELPWRPRQGWEITPFLEASFHPDGRAREAARASRHNAAATLAVGLQVSRHF